MPCFQVVWAASRVEEEAFESSGGSRNGVLSAVSISLRICLLLVNECII